MAFLRYFGYFSAIHEDVLAASSGGAQERTTLFVLQGVGVQECTVLPSELCAVTQQSDDINGLQSPAPHSSQADMYHVTGMPSG